MSNGPVASETTWAAPAPARERCFALPHAEERAADGRPSEAKDFRPRDLPERLDALDVVLCAPVLRGDAPVVAARPVNLEPCVHELVRQIAWGGDRRRGAARIELGAGRFAGASVVVHAEGRSVTLEVNAPAGTDAASLGERLRERLEDRGLVVREVRVR